MNSRWLKNQNRLNREQVQELFDYNPNNGKLVRKTSISGNARVGDEVGFRGNCNYLQVVINGRKYNIHHLVWLWHHDCWPINHLDFVDSDSTNTRIENLQERTPKRPLILEDLIIKDIGGIPDGEQWEEGLDPWLVRVRICGNIVNVARHHNFNKALQTQLAAERSLGRPDDQSLIYYFLKERGESSQRRVAVDIFSDLRQAMAQAPDHEIPGLLRAAAQEIEGHKMTKNAIK